MWQKGDFVKEAEVNTSSTYPHPAEEVEDDGQGISSLKTILALAHVKDRRYKENKDGLHPLRVSASGAGPKGL
jgi:hypothetical protein